ASMVKLNGSSSPGCDLTFLRTQVAGPLVVLAEATSATPHFRVPLLAFNRTLTFQLTVTGGGVSRTDTVDITVRRVNNAPVADAGGDKSVSEGSLVTLNADGSYDPDGDEVFVQWVQTSGPAG